MNEEQIIYVEEQLAAGFTESAIRLVMAENDYPQALIDDIFVAVKTRATPIESVPLETPATPEEPVEKAPAVTSDSPEPTERSSLFLFTMLGVIGVLLLCLGALYLYVQSQMDTLDDVVTLPQNGAAEAGTESDVPSTPDTDVTAEASADSSMEVGDDSDQANRTESVDISSTSEAVAAGVYDGPATYSDFTETNPFRPKLSEITDKYKADGLSQEDRVQLALEDMAVFSKAYYQSNNSYEGFCDAVGIISARSYLSGKCEDGAEGFLLVHATGSWANSSSETLGCIDVNGSVDIAIDEAFADQEITSWQCEQFKQ